MHEYVAASARRHVVIWKLAAASVALSVGIGWLAHELDVPTFIAPPAGTVVFGVVFWLFDRYLWRAGVRGRNISRIPNLRGTWQGEIEIRKGRGTEQTSETFTCTVQIRQTWREISIQFSTSFTESKSVMASLGPRDGGSLNYEYDVKQRPGAAPGNDRVNRHFGTAHLSPQNDAWTALEGSFYNDQDYQRWGPYELTLVQH
jgi:hypothetical protein